MQKDNKLTGLPRAFQFLWWSEKEVNFWEYWLEQKWLQREKEYKMFLIFTENVAVPRRSLGSFSCSRARFVCFVCLCAQLHCCGLLQADFCRDFCLWQLNKCASILSALLCMSPVFSRPCLWSTCRRVVRHPGIWELVCRLLTWRSCEHSVLLSEKHLWAWPTHVLDKSLGALSSDRVRGDQTYQSNN